eukprot:gene28105-34776_t
MTASDVVSMISEDHLAKAQQQYLEESASRFLADLALSKAWVALTGWRTVAVHLMLDQFRLESEQYMEDGLEAVIAVYHSRWYREIRQAAAISTSPPSPSSTSVAAGPSGAIYTVDPRPMKSEQCQIKDVRKLVEGLPEFPSNSKSPEPLDDLEAFAKTMLKLMTHMT